MEYNSSRRHNNSDVCCKSRPCGSSGEAVVVYAPADAEVRCWLQVRKGLRLFWLARQRHIWALNECLAIVQERETLSSSLTADMHASTSRLCRNRGSAQICWLQGRATDVHVKTTSLRACRTVYNLADLTEDEAA